MIVIGLDPGTEQSAFVMFNGERICQHEILSNEDILGRVQDGFVLMRQPAPLNPVLVLEDIQSYGMAVGVETFRTVFWSGRFAQAWGKKFVLMGRRDVKQHLCFSARATDANIRQALIDRFGPGKEKAIGTKKAQGPLYGLKGHEFAALAVAVTYYDRQSPSSVRFVADGIGF